MAWYDGIGQAVSSAFSGWDSKDTALTMQAAGTVAGAWGQYESDKKRNKLLSEQFDYEKQKDKVAQGRLDKAQASLDDAFDNSILNPNKKKKDTTAESLTPSLAIA